MATVELIHETTYEFDIDDFVEEWHEEFLDWLEDQDEEEGYAETEVAKKDFVEDAMEELGADDIRWASHVFKEKDDDFTMTVRGVYS